mmetsp:Transcript_28477/g.43786  ORF Transcript_28477/g.43786 Transcript_28477/m.43786 type:complete len:96 (-) Transcript_28477:404-691(-)|eukprot:CAMPEP_0118673698 /NCGR_PEP_ID=MMETSP0800-20121206/477_1 /TAXON_ID=210618 ORGANISM="Striatella unipunctata, Strain CCMP2910" /NCGR_SAMPLE_ID=MMETSP0800 /ASSEMBLY_ACC=CAM_ASM_000638 /LENGTH=95 /DNA_ID=CAMNT_0006568811 /DNA_START=127 /DNA_END=414 /DNA_ORIENTATION=-
MARFHLFLLVLALLLQLSVATVDGESRLLRRNKRRGPLQRGPLDFVGRRKNRRDRRSDVLRPGRRNGRNDRGPFEKKKQKARAKVRSGILNRKNV